MLTYFIFNFKKVHFEEFFVAFGTIMLAAFTYDLATRETRESREMRQLMIQEARRERRRLRLKEQLEAFYAPLRADLELIFFKYQIFIDRHRAFRKVMHDNEIKKKYEYLALDKLKEQLREYFRMWEDLNSFAVRKHYTDVGTENTEKIIIEKLEEITKTIFEDYKNLIKEYNDLTKTVS